MWLFGDLTYSEKRSLVFDNLQLQQIRVPYALIQWYTTHRDMFRKTCMSFGGVMQRVSLPVEMTVIGTLL
jgi:hypothetical protein